MEDEELYELQARVSNRLADYANCDTSSANKFITLISKEYVSKGAALYAISDRLDARGY